MARRRNKSEERGTAVRRIDQLLAVARNETLAGRPDLALRYGELSLRVAQKYQSGLTSVQKAALCRKCGAPRSATTSRTRFSAGRLAVTCLLCGSIARRPLHARALARAGAAPTALAVSLPTGPSVRSSPSIPSDLSDLSDPSAPLHGDP